MSFVIELRCRVYSTENKKMDVCTLKLIDVEALGQMRGPAAVLGAAAEQQAKAFWTDAVLLGVLDK